MHHDGLDLGPFFEIEAIVVGAQLPHPWRPVTDMATDTDVLDRRVHAVRVALGGADRVEARVAASVAHLGLVARLIAPLLATGVLTGRSVDLAHACWQDRLGGPYPLAASLADERPGPDPLIGQITAAFERYRVSARVLGGNVASAVNGAAAMITAADPARGRRAAQAADRWLADPRVEDGRLRSGPGFRRRSCCLIYRVAGDRSGICGDCVLGGASTAR